MSTSRDLSHLSDTSFCFLQRSEYIHQLHSFLMELNRGRDEILARFNEKTIPPEMEKLLSSIDAHRARLLEEIRTMRTGLVEMK